MRRSRRPHHREAGILLVPVVFVVVVIAGLSAAFLTRGVEEQTAGTHYETSTRALEIAEMALLAAEMELSGAVDRDGDGLGNLSGSFGGGTYEVRAAQDAGDPAFWVVTATGWHGLSRRRIEVGLRIRHDYVFNYAIFGRDHVTLQSGSSTDSFDSDVGTYASQVVGSDASGPYAGMDAPAGSNGDIVLQGGAGVVRGDATPGPSGTVSISAPAWVTGSTDAAAESVAVPDPPRAEFEAALASNDNAALDLWHLNVDYDAATFDMHVRSGYELFFPEGTYFFHDLSLTGGARIRTEGSCRIYVTGNMDLSGGAVVNGTGVAKDLLVVAHPYDLPEGAADPSAASHSMRTTGSGACTMAIYAPAYDVNVYGGSEYFGAVVCRDLDMYGDSRVHYDEALSRVAGGGPRTMRIYWVDRQVPRF